MQGQILASHPHIHAQHHLCEMDASAAAPMPSWDLLAAIPEAAVMEDIASQLMQMQCSCRQATGVLLDQQHRARPASIMAQAGQDTTGPIA